MSDYYYIYQTYIDQLHRALIGLAGLAVVAVVGWYLVAWLTRASSPVIRRMVQTIYLMCCAGVYVALVAFVGRG
jgi:hypothetical protein